MNEQRAVAIVTGAASGTGKRVAKLYAQNGVAVVLSDVSQESGEQAAEQIRQAGGQAIFVAADVSHPADCERMVTVALEQYGRLDYACNNAGIGGEQNLTADYSVDGWVKILAINLSGVFYCMKYQIPAILKSGGGAIVNMASILGQVGFGGSVGYVAGKHGVLGLTKGAGLEYAEQGIRINAVGAGFIRISFASFASLREVNFHTKTRSTPRKKQEAFCSRQMDLVKYSFASRANILSMHAEKTKEEQIVVRGARTHNLKNISVNFPVQTDSNHRRLGQRKIFACL